MDTDIAKIHPTYNIHQIKEKFGGLRFYIGGVPTEVYKQVMDLIKEAEDLSLKTCENCGQPGVLCQRRTWLKTLCKKCFSEWEVETEDQKLFNINNLPFSL